MSLSLVGFLFFFFFNKADKTYFKMQGQRNDLLEFAEWRSLAQGKDSFSSTGEKPNWSGSNRAGGEGLETSG